MMSPSRVFQRLFATLIVGFTVGAATLTLYACTTVSALRTSSAGPASWDSRLRGDAVVMLGEVHDNRTQHQLRLEILRRAFAAGWRPAILMEQFDRERQADIDRARREKADDAQYVVESATAPGSSAGGGGWNWEFYRPYVELALQYGVPLVAVNLSRADAAKVVHGGYAAVFDAATIAALGLNEPIPADWQRIQEQEIETGHCNAMPAEMLAPMAKAQFARDAVMAGSVREYAKAGGVVLLAGNGHVRRDIGVPRWLGADLQARVFAVGFLEKGESDSDFAKAFDAVVYTAAAKRKPPCEEFKQRDRSR